MTVIENYTLFFSLKITLFSFSLLLLPFIESQEKINGMGIIFNFGVKWVSGEICTGKQGKEKKIGNWTE